MKQLTLIAFLLLGVVGCTKTERESIAKEANEVKAPPISWQHYCMACATPTFEISRCVQLGQPGETWNIECISYGVGHAVRFSPADIINDSVSSDLDTSVARNFMNTYLWGFDKGAEYISYYEQIGLAMVENGGIPIMDIPAHYTFALATYAVADSMQTGSSTCVPITTAYKADALDMIDYWRLRCDEPMFQTSLDSIEADLNRHVGKTKAQIYDFYESQ